MTDETSHVVPAGQIGAGPVTVNRTRILDLRPGLVEFGRRGKVRQPARRTGMVAHSDANVGAR